MLKWMIAAIVIGYSGMALVVWSAFLVGWPVLMTVAGVLMIYVAVVLTRTINRWEGRNQ